MALPTTRAEFKDYCLRRVGAPVSQINVDDDQIEDRIDDALQYYWDYHFDGSEKQYYKALVTAERIVRQGNVVCWLRLLHQSANDDLCEGGNWI